MAYVIGAACIDEVDRSCLDECPVDCIYVGARKSYIQPDECVDCGACVPACPVDAISDERLVSDSDREHVADSRRFFYEPLADGRPPLGSPGGSHLVGEIGLDTPLVANYRVAADKV